jgi:autotransporter-associated beta strand protein
LTEVAAVWCLAFLTTSALAQVYWDGGAGNNRWNSSANWRPNGIPTAASHVVLDNTYDADLPASLALRGNYSVNSLTFDLDETLDVVNGTGSRTLTLASGGLTRTTGSSGAQSLQMTSLALGADSLMTIGGTGSLTISSQITGTFAVTKAGAGELVLAGSNTFSGGVTLDAGTLTLASNTALGTGSLTLAGGTLRLSDVNVSLATLSITGDTIIDFAGSASTLAVSQLTIGAGVTVTITNWLRAADYFYAVNWDGAVYDQTDQAPMNQVVFTGATQSTGWESIDNQIRPVPEPRTYGAVLLTLAAGALGWRRHRRTTTARAAVRSLS